MAKPSAKAEEYRTRAQAMGWSELFVLWNDILADKTAGWDDGKALEHLVIRGFELSKLPVEYPYDVPPGGKPLEQIDGLVYLNDIAFLVECKDKDKVDVEAVAKLQHQLLRRPPTAMGCVFVSGKFTEPALVLAGYTAPHRITLWSGVDIKDALSKKDFGGVLRKKYHDLCMYGLTDCSPNYKVQEVKDE